MTSIDDTTDVPIALDSIGGVLDSLDQIRVQKAELAEHERALLELIKDQMGDNGTVGTVAGKVRVTWRGHTRTTIDTKALRADHPEIADKVSKTSIVRRFQIVDKDEA